jgi:hypothetical protein
MLSFLRRAITRDHYIGGENSSYPSSVGRCSIIVSGTVGGVYPYSSGDTPHANGQSWTTVALYVSSSKDYKWPSPEPRL